MRHLSPQIAASSPDLDSLDEIDQLASLARGIVDPDNPLHLLRIALAAVSACKRLGQRIALQGKQSP